jgi:hypothetical protein
METSGTVLGPDQLAHGAGVVVEAGLMGVEELAPAPDQSPHGAEPPVAVAEADVLAVVLVVVFVLTSGILAALRI